jgi:hypothetical protein
LAEADSGLFFPAEPFFLEPAGAALRPAAQCKILIRIRRGDSGSVQGKFRAFEEWTLGAVSSYSAHSFVLANNHSA